MGMGMWRSGCQFVLTLNMSSAAKMWMRQEKTAKAKLQET